MTLRVDPEELANLHLIEEAHYITGEQPDGVRCRDRASYAVPYDFYPPTDGRQSMAGFLYPDPYGEEIVLKADEYGNDQRGARAISGDGQYIGEVEKSIASPKTGRITHSNITRGLLVKEHKMIPRHWISQMVDGELWIAVSDRMIGRLPDVELGQLS